ncbi:MAG TPA: hypothetical protein VKY57_05810 [Chitinispirillaceae bacterium]|nr:hypothetical protein [Fibrobacter sp.]HLV31069.1 hypothetical protein [Chitinispirillaceae bacterium]
MVAMVMSICPFRYRCRNRYPHNSRFSSCFPVLNPILFPNVREKDSRTGIV